MCSAPQQTIFISLCLRVFVANNLCHLSATPSGGICVFFVSYLVRLWRIRASYFGFIMSYIVCVICAIRDQIIRVNLCKFVVKKSVSFVPRPSSVLLYPLPRIYSSTHPPVTSIEYPASSIQPCAHLPPKW